jgi:hypothetical protein
MVHKVPLGIQELEGLEGMMVYKDLLGMTVYKGLLVLKVQLVLKDRVDIKVL